MDVEKVISKGPGFYPDEPSKKLQDCRIRKQEVKTQLREMEESISGDEELSDLLKLLLKSTDGKNSKAPILEENERRNSSPAVLCCTNERFGGKKADETMLLKLSTSLEVLDMYRNCRDSLENIMTDIASRQKDEVSAKLIKPFLTLPDHQKGYDEANKLLHDLSLEDQIKLSRMEDFPKFLLPGLNQVILLDTLRGYIDKGCPGMFRECGSKDLITSVAAKFSSQAIPDIVLQSPVELAVLFKRVFNTRDSFLCYEFSHYADLVSSRFDEARKIEHVKMLFQRSLDAREGQNLKWCWINTISATD